MPECPRAYAGYSSPKANLERRMMRLIVQMRPARSYPAQMSYSQYSLPFHISASQPRFPESPPFTFSRDDEMAPAQFPWENRTFSNVERLVLPPSIDNIATNVAFKHQ
ncbi:hypothetical protein ALUC_81030A [Aspergillus luchuensis]|nr:hypothetical protein ALUC_81030A [Aspergillus luchuensis]